MESGKALKKREHLDSALIYKRWQLTGRNDGHSRLSSTVGTTIVIIPSCYSSQR